MQSDLPHTLYSRRDEKGKPVKRVNKNDRAFSLQEAALRKAEARREAKERGEAPYTINELFKK